MSWLENIEERVVQAYREKGLKAVPWMFVPVQADKEHKGCCGLGALVYDPKNPLDRNRLTMQNVATLLGATKDEVDDFTLGFDMAVGNGTHREHAYLNGDAMKAGYDTGMRCVAEGLRQPRRTTVIVK